MSDIGQIFIPISDICDQRHQTERAKSDIISDIGIKFYSISNIRHPLLLKRVVIAEWYSTRLRFKGRGFESYWCPRNFCKCQISEWILMAILEHPPRNFCKCQISEWTLMSILEHPPMKITIFRCKYMHTAEEKKSWQIHETYIFRSKIIDTFCDIVYFPGKKGNAFRNVQANCDIWTPKWTKIRWTQCHTPGP